jgi:alanyl-tRNA synthetase
MPDLRFGSLNSSSVGTERLYYTGSYQSSFQANVARLSNAGTSVYLDRTAFYPTSGGQPHDLGVINGIPVLDVVDEGSEIEHKLESPMTETPVGGTVDCIVDWHRRYEHMQQHTGQHLLSAVFMELFNFATLSFHMGAEVSTIELATAELSEIAIGEAQLRAAQLIGEARPVLVRFEDAAEAQALRKASARAGTLRIVDIESVDRSACGGTHVRNLAECGPILIRRHERVRSNVRIEFVCGTRALELARQDFRQLSDSAKACGVPPANLLPTIQNLYERLASAEKDSQRLSLDLAKRDGRQHWEDNPASDGGLRRISLTCPTLGEQSRALAQSCVERGRAAIFIAGLNPRSVLFSVSEDAELHAGDLLKAALAARGLRGGGSRTMAQGSVRNEEDIAAIAAELGFAVHPGTI